MITVVNLEITNKEMFFKTGEIKEEVLKKCSIRTSKSYELKYSVDKNDSIDNLILSDNSLTNSDIQYPINEDVIHLIEIGVNTKEDMIKLSTFISNPYSRFRNNLLDFKTGLSSVNVKSFNEVKYENIKEFLNECNNTENNVIILTNTEPYIINELTLREDNVINPSSKLNVLLENRFIMILKIGVIK